MSKTNKKNLPKTKKKKTTIKKKKPKHSPREIVLPNVSTPQEQLIRSKVKPFSEVNSTKEFLDTVRSYSPSINQELVSKHPEMKMTDIFGCGLEKTLIDGSNLFKKRSSNVWIAKDSVCKPWNSTEAIETMLDNLRSSPKFNVSNVITPQQIDSNCWFNVFFVTFFISDKGRKFFRFFRELMIRGKHTDGREISPEMAHALFFLNACIEAAYNNKNVALALNTNHVILKIFDSISPKDIKQLERKGISDIDEAGNPLVYYNALIEYIGGSAIRHRNINNFYQVSLLFNSKMSAENAAHLYTVDVDPSFNLHIPTSFKVGSFKYTLDAATVLDTKMRHFCCTLTCGKKQMGFDGASFSRLTPFKWKDLLNQNQNWTFKGSIFDNDAKKKILWNFRRGFVTLFYYRT